MAELCSHHAPLPRGAGHMVILPLHRHRGLRGRRILIVEDQAVIAIWLEQEITAAGATVIGPASTLDHALKLIERAQRTGGLSAAVLDIRLFAKSVLPAADRLAALG